MPNQVKSVSIREAYYQSHRIARLVFDGERENPAYWAANAATDYLASSQWYEPFLEVQDAVLWAIHWAKGTPKPGLPLWASERNYWLTAGATRGDSGFCYPRIPMLPGETFRKEARQVAAIEFWKTDIAFPDLVEGLALAKAAAELEDCRS